MLKEVQAFADVNVAWLSKQLTAAEVVEPWERGGRELAPFMLLSQVLKSIARSRSNISAL